MKVLGDKGGLNLYSYVRNNPIATYDPFGLYTIDAKTCAQVDDYIKAYERLILRRAECSAPSRGNAGMSRKNGHSRFSPL
ncbi:MAG TPA: hypothetical protein VK615_07565 [Candidatus Binatia bacterium]|nr:hypothetical protein [Candidatus Binatia bacterium]